MTQETTAERGKVDGGPPGWGTFRIGVAARARAAQCHEDGTIWKHISTLHISTPGPLKFAEGRTVTWTRMEEGTREDYRYLAPAFDAHARGRLVDNVLDLLRLLRGPKLGYQVDRYEHSLQSASRALRNDERSDLVVGALLHDVADSFAPENHSEGAAAILAPYVDEETHWVVKHHGLFQGYYYFHHFDGDRNARELYRSSPHYDACVRFCAEYDQNSFDPDYPTLPVETFRPLLDEVFNRPALLDAVARTGVSRPS